MKYHKISGPFRRHIDGPDRGKIIYGDWSCGEFEDLSNIEWVWTEKIDGTNVRVMWDGYSVSFAGRTDNAQLHASLYDYLYATFTEELMEQVFGVSPVVVYGEGVGEKIQGGHYGHEYRMIVFDVLFVNGGFASRDAVNSICDSLGVESVQTVVVGTPEDAMLCVKDMGGDYFEGLVGTPALGYADRKGERIIMKVKARDVAEYAHLLP